ncbi:MAG TPA: AmmeMemoRadiSam system protein A, partial [Terriglobales bacterium]|nr:AmmeMemoRadiSam system protein A [Terriglobales bacterium]
MSPSPDRQASGSRIACGTGNTEQSEFSREERKLLLKLAHEAIVASLEHRELSLSPVPPHLNESRGAFTTLYFRGELRGCVGHVYPIDSLYRTVAETARAAAFEDTRFWPITLDDAAELEISLSVLSPLRPVQPEQVEVGRHGLLVSLHQHRGLLLPQVPIEHGWDRVTFLEQTCRKAGLPSDAWQTGAQIEV